MPKKFLRRNWNRFSKFGKRKKRKQRWKKPTGRDNKMREKKRGYSPVVSIGYRTNKKVRGTFNEKKPIKIMKIEDLVKIKNNQIAHLGNVGKKKKIEIIKKAKTMKIEFDNVNINSFLKKNEIKKNSEKKSQTPPNKSEKMEKKK